MVVFSVSPAGGAAPTSRTEWISAAAARAADSAVRSASQASAAVGSWPLLTREVESDTQPVAFASQLDVPVVSRTGAGLPSAPTPSARVSLAPLPPHPATSAQSTTALADAVPVESASVALSAAA